jgi:CDP-glycerol glycerophosphotransferase (TagB/SpsB family)
MEWLTRAVHKIATAMDITVTYPLYWLSCAMPRSDRTWVFIGWHRGSTMEIFADNTKYLFLHVAHDQKEVRPIWLAKDEQLAQILRSRGYESYSETSLRGIWYALRAGTTVIDAYLQRWNFRWSGRSRLIQLLHGRGMKKKGYGDPQLRRQDYICCTSPFTAELLSPIFKQDAQIYHTGFPRNDVFFHKIDGADIGVDGEGARRLQEIRGSGKKAILYAPTFRRGEKTFGLAARLPLEELNAWLSERGLHLFISLHPKYRDQSRGQQLDCISFVANSDIYPLLPSFDLLVADYSSLTYDFVLLDKPIVFFPYDLEQYRETEGLAFSYDIHTPGPKAYDVANLQSSIEAILANDTYAAERQRVRALYHLHADGDSAVRVMSAMRAR